MALVHPNSCECTKSAPTQTSVAYGYWEQKGLTSALTDQGPFECAVSGGDHYIDLANTYLFVEAQIVDDYDSAEQTLDLSTYGCIPSLEMSVLVSTKNWFFRRPYRAYI
jgi:hypothetical protein